MSGRSARPRHGTGAFIYERAVRLSVANACPGLPSPGPHRHAVVGVTSWGHAGYVSRLQLSVAVLVIALSSWATGCFGSNADDSPSRNNAAASPRGTNHGGLAAEGPDPCGLTAEAVSAAVGLSMRRGGGGGRPGRIRCTYMSEDPVATLGIVVPLRPEANCPPWLRSQDEPRNQHGYGARAGEALVVLQGPPSLTVDALSRLLVLVDPARCRVRPTREPKVRTR